MTVVDIAGIAAGGDGVARLDSGLTVFVPRTAPGDRVEIQITQQKRRFARARVRRLQERATERVPPRCPHYERDGCGGCQLQHVSVAAQVDVKRRIVGDAVRRIGHRDVPDPAGVAAPAPWRYRTRMTLAARGGRIGYHRHDRPGEVFDLHDCLITRERVTALWQSVSVHRERLPRRLAALGFREDRLDRLHVVVCGRDAQPWDASALAAAVGDPAVCYWWQPPGGAARVVAGPRNGFPATGFEQAHPEFAERIRRIAVEALGPVAGRPVWDLYGGVGDAADLLASRGAEAWTVDADRRAIAWAVTQDRRRAAPRVHRIAGRVERVLPELPVPDAVVVNPPRAGLARDVATWLDRWGGERPGHRVVYVSCDPATLARDLARMPQLGLRELTAFDLFPQTSHVETLAVLEAA